jgi:curved DNA-binding protein CbpA
MVKADVRRDYYADLGLQPSAEAEDIKKQFRRLGERSKDTSS